LTENRCCWDFDKRTLKIGGKEVSLFSRTSRSLLGRVYETEQTVVQTEC